MEGGSNFGIHPPPPPPNRKPVGTALPDVMRKGVFSIFKKDPLLTYNLVIFITVVYLIILLLLNNFEFVLRKQSNFRPNFYAAVS